MAQWLRFAIFAVILLSFLRRIFKASQNAGVGGGSRPGQVSYPTTFSKSPQTLVRPQQGRKNDFRDIPPPPENPDLG